MKQILLSHSLVFRHLDNDCSETSKDEDITENNPKYLAIIILANECPKNMILFRRDFLLLFRDCH